MSWLASAKCKRSKRVDPVLSIRDLCDWRVPDTNAHRLHVTGVGAAGAVRNEVHHWWQWSSLGEVHDRGHPTMNFSLQPSRRHEIEAIPLVILTTWPGLRAVACGP